MRAVVQRVTSAQVQVAGQVVGAIERGLLVLLSAGQGDAPADAAWMVDKLAGLRIFPDAEGKMNLDVRQVSGAVLVVSQFTLHGDARRGKRPSFLAAMEPEEAARRIAIVVDGLRRCGLAVAEGAFGADMQVALINDGPVTILLDSQKTF